MKWARKVPGRLRATKISETRVKVKKVKMDANDPLAGKNLTCRWAISL